jgi:hypothetical protein
MLIKGNVASRRNGACPLLPFVLLALVGACDAALEAPAPEAAPQPEAVSVVASPLAGGTVRCSAVRCREGFRCEETPRGVTCIPESAGCICEQIFLPVCGTDNRTYSNACVARCLKVEVQHPGPCPGDAVAEAADLTESQRSLRKPPCQTSTELEASATTDRCDPCVKLESGQLVPVCAAGETCVAEEVVCVRAPCPPIARCEPA